MTGVSNDMQTNLTGVRVAGLVNAGPNLRGAEASLLFNDSDAVRGVQVAGGFNRADNLRGVQICGLYNHLASDDGARGVQLTAVLNFSNSPLTGLALGGVCNWHSAPTRGAMVSLFNLTTKMNGIQIGLMNDATELHGVQLGLFNFENGRMRLPLINATGLW